MLDMINVDRAGFFIFLHEEKRWNCEGSLQTVMGLNEKEAWAEVELLWGTYPEQLTLRLCSSDPSKSKQIFLMAEAWIYCKWNQVLKTGYFFILYGCKKSETVAVSSPQLWGPVYDLKLCSGAESEFRTYLPELLTRLRRANELTLRSESAAVRAMAEEHVTGRQSRGSG